MDTYESDKYYCTIKNIDEMLNKYGVAIIPNLLDDEETKKMQDGMWQTLEYLTKDTDFEILKMKQSSWRNITSLFPLHSMLIQHWSIGHSQFIWDLRQNIKVLEVFANLYRVTIEDLLVSFDGASFHMPPEYTNIGWNKNNTWFHSDQSFLRPDRECIQSWINGFDTNIGDATLALLEGSHKYHREFKDTFNITNKDDWYKLNEDEYNFYSDKGCKEVRISCPKGSLVLWDSRTIHCGIEPFKERKTPNFRCVVYLCYQPRTMVDNKNIEKKQKAFEELRMTSHWPCKVKLFAKTPRTYGKEIPNFNQIPIPTLSSLGKKLAGF